MRLGLDGKQTGNRDPHFETNVPIQLWVKPLGQYIQNHSKMFEQAILRMFIHIICQF